MRILHVTDGYHPRVGGIEIFVEDLASRQAAAGHDVSVLTATPADVDPPRQPVEVLRTPPSGLHPWAPPAARETAAGGGYDLVHAHLSVVSPFTTAVARAADGAGIPIVGTVHSMWASRRTVVRVVRTVAGWDGSGITWTAVSRVAAAEVRDVLGPRTDVHVVPNAVDVEWWRAGSRTQRRAPAVILVSVMRLAGRKRPHALLEIVDAVRTALPDGPDIRLLVIGDGPLAHQLQGEVGRRGLGGTVTLLGRLTREEIRAVYGATDVFVSAARQESFGIAALEARAAGRGNEGGGNRGVHRARRRRPALRRRRRHGRGADRPGERPPRANGDRGSQPDASAGRELVAHHRRLRRRLRPGAAPRRPA
jgi:phosphatidylinositol alpha 1,6-mannosyltransferase